MNNGNVPRPCTLPVPSVEALKTSVSLGIALVVRARGGEIQGCAETVLFDDGDMTKFVPVLVVCMTMRMHPRILSRMLNSVDYPIERLVCSERAECFRLREPTHIAAVR